MLSLEQLNALRGTKAEAAVPNALSKNISNEPQNASQPVNSEENTQSEIKYPEPVEVPCKNYDDEDGHFAYIDANTHQAIHVNLISGRPYTQDDVNRLSLLKVTNSLSEEAKKLVWQQVINDKTQYDQFGSPMFTHEEIQNALNKMQTGGNEKTEENKPKTDPWGLPL